MDSLGARYGKLPSEFLHVPYYEFFLTVQAASKNKAEEFKGRLAEQAFTFWLENQKQIKMNYGKFLEKLNLVESTKEDKETAKEKAKQALKRAEEIKKAHQTKNRGERS